MSRYANYLREECNTWNVPPKISGIYFLILNNRVVYVGQSVDIHRRVMQHRDDKKPFDEILFKEFPVEQLNEREAYYIDYYNPPQNKRKPRVWAFIQNTK